MIKSIIFIVLISLGSTSFTQEPYSFFVAGHTYGDPGVNNPGLHPPFLAAFDSINADTSITFGVLTGDIVSPNPIAQDWDEVDSNLATLNVPVHFAVGNHDMENRPLYESRYGDTYYSLMKGKDLCIFLDPNIDGWNISGDQLDFLKTTLSDLSEVRNIYVFMHQLIWREDDNKYAYIAVNSFVGRADEVNFWTEVEPLFHNNGHQTYFFAGDLGAGDWSSDFAYDRYDNINFIASGMGGPFGDHYIVVNVDKWGNLSYDFECLDSTGNFCENDLTFYRKTTYNEDEEFWFYPNPAYENLTVELNPNESSIIKIHDLNGKILLELTVSEVSFFRLDFNDLKNGTYILSVNDSQKSMRKRFVKL
ncbi:MAG: T9SS type A sorting domain-containing protein [Crocinitomicaceae bacterium]